VRSLDLSKRIREAAERGDSFAQFQIAIDLENGTGCEPDFQLAADWYAKAASQGQQTAEGNFLLQHVLGQTDILSPAEVFARLKARAATGDLAAENNLGLCYQSGYGTPLSSEDAIACFRRAALGGQPTAQFNLGGHYFEGNGVEKDLSLAVEWYTRAAEQREELALVQLGSMYQKGIGVDLDLNRAVVLYLLAYRLRSVRAACHLGFMFKKGLGVDRDDSLAYALYLESVAGSDTPDIGEEISYRGSAFYWLGYMAERGEGIERNLRAAKRWYGRGAACGESNCIEAVARLRPSAARECRVSERT
jgi:TPR repeat protein